jgi:hypothetical protein
MISDLKLVEVNRRAEMFLWGQVADKQNNTSNCEAVAGCDSGLLNKLQSLLSRGELSELRRAKDALKNLFAR